MPVSKKHGLLMVFLVLAIIVVCYQLSWSDASFHAASPELTHGHCDEPSNRVIHGFDSEPNAVIPPDVSSSNGTVLMPEEYEVMPKHQVKILYQASSNNYKKIVPPTYMRSFKSPCWVQENIGADLNWNGAAMLNCLPYFYIVGFGKCASTDIYSKISSHPHVLYPREKEVVFWNRKTLATYFNSDMKPALETLRLKCTAGYPCPYIFGDGSVSYFRHTGEVSKAIHHFTPNAKMIMTVRDPVERLYSYYIHFTKPPTASPKNFHQRVQSCLSKWEECHSVNSTGWCVDNLESACQVDIRGCMYQVYIERWLQVFGPENLYVIQYEQWKSDTTDELKKLYNYLDLAPQPDSFYQTVLGAAHRNMRTVFHSRDQSPMRDDTRDQLQRFFQPFNEELAMLLNDTKWIYT